MQNGLEASDAEAAMTAFGEAVEFYRQACAALPRDEEKAAHFLYAGLQACWFGNKKFEDVLFFLMWAQDLIPDMLKIWEHSATSVPRDSSLDVITRFSVACLKAKFDGRLHESQIVKPISVVSIIL
jgi:hypothetical protein